MSAHTHPGEKLTIGCPACIERVKADQAAAEFVDYPERDIVVKYSAKAWERGSVTLTTNVRPGETPDDVLDRCVDQIEDLIADHSELAFATDWEFEVDSASFAKPAEVAS